MGIVKFSRAKNIEIFCTNARRPVIVLAASAPGLIDVFSHLGQVLRNRGFEIALVIPSHISLSAIENVIPIFNYHPKCLKNVDQEILVIGQDNPMILPPQIKYLALPHAFLRVKADHAEPEIYSGYGYCLLYHDYLFLPQTNLLRFGSDDLSPVFEGQFPQEMHCRGTDDFIIIPGGYPKIDWLRMCIEDMKITPDAILYAPTVYSKFACDPFFDGQLIISTLLSSAPNHRVIYRPFPADVQLDVSVRLASFFADHERFEFDQSPSTLNSMARATLVVTDASLTALTFSLATTRAHINCNLCEEKDLSPHDFGYTVHSERQLCHALKRILDDPSGVKELVSTNRKGYMLNDGNTFQYLADCAEKIYYGEDDPTWININRHPNSLSINEPKDAARLIASSRYGSDHGMILQHTMEKFPQSAWLRRYAKGWNNLIQFQPAALLPDYGRGEIGMLSKSEILKLLTGKLIFCNYTYMIYGCGGGYRERWGSFVSDHPSGFMGFLDGLQENWGRIVDGHPVYPSHTLLKYKPRMVLIGTHVSTAALAAVMLQMPE